MKEVINMNLSKNGKFIAEMRKAKQMTQEQLAEKVGLSINAVSKWERGLSFPDVALYKKICKELDISLEELINGEKDSSEDAKNRAIINIVKSKEKTKKKLRIVVLFSIIMFALLIAINIFFYKTDEDRISAYYERNYEKTFVARNVEAVLKYRNNGNYPDYFGGMYISDDAYSLIVLIVKDKIPDKDSLEYKYYNELFTIDKSVKIEYVNNSYNDLEAVLKQINDYITTHDVPEDFNSVGIDVKKNKVVVNYVKVNDSIKKEFKENIIDSNLVEFEEAADYICLRNECPGYPSEIGTDVLEEHGDLLINIRIGNKQYISVSLNVYDDGTYELFTSYLACKSGRVCNTSLIYSKSIKGTYDYDIIKILEASTNANDKTYAMNNLPEYEIYLGERLIEKYDTLTFTVENGKKNKYLDEFLSSINADLSNCAMPDYKD